MRDKNVINFLLVGFDASNSNTDALIIASLNKKEEKIYLHSVFRDCYTYISTPNGDHFAKINACYANGGVEKLIEMVECNFEMDIMPGLENITTVLPFENAPTKYFMTTKQNCMPCGGTFKYGDEVWEFSKENTFCALDWGRVNTPHRMVWYWGNGSTYLTDEEGKKHIFGFEITWAIGDESNATETCLFYDGKAHKFGAVDVETFPKPDKYMNDWKFISEDGRFNLTMKPFFDQHSDMNVGVARMHTHQVHGLWSGDVTLDDGTKLEIKDMYAFCEYVENKW